MGDADVSHTRPSNDSIGLRDHHHYSRRPIFRPVACALMHFLMRGHVLLVYRHILKSAPFRDEGHRRCRRHADRNSGQGSLWSKRR